MKLNIKHLPSGEVEELPKVEFTPKEDAIDFARYLCHYYKEWNNDDDTYMDYETKEAFKLSEIYKMWEKL